MSPSQYIVYLLPAIRFLAFFLSHGSPGGGRCMRPPLLFFTNYVGFVKKSTLCMVLINKN